MPTSDTRTIELHLSMKQVKRAAGGNALQKAAYHHRERYYDRRLGVAHNYRRKDSGDDLDYLIGYHGTARELWHDVEVTEDALAFKPDRAQTAHYFDVACPVELDRVSNMLCLVELVRWIHKETGAPVDLAMHNSNPDNPHGHIMFAQRAYDEKSRQWSHKKFRTFNSKDGQNGLERLREKATYIFNKYLDRAQRRARIEHQSFEARGVDKIPTRHRGPKATYLYERLGVLTTVELDNAATKNRNLRRAIAASDKPADTAASKQIAIPQTAVNPNPTETMSTSAQKTPPTQTSQSESPPGNGRKIATAGETDADGDATGADTPVQVRSLLNDGWRAINDNAVVPAKPHELGLEDYSVIADADAGVLAFAVVVSDDPTDDEAQLLVRRLRATTTRAAQAELRELLATNSQAYYRVPRYTLQAGDVSQEPKKEVKAK